MSLRGKKLVINLIGVGMGDMEGGGVVVILIATWLFVVYFLLLLPIIFVITQSIKKQLPWVMSVIVILLVALSLINASFWNHPTHDVSMFLFSLPIIFLVIFLLRLKLIKKYLLINLASFLVYVFIIIGLMINILG